MLQKLHIRNFTLIDELDISFFPGFSVITGETGAGKSIILGALGLLTGNRADARQVKTGAPKCVVEATFSTGHDIYGTIKKFFDDNDLDFVADECILRREVSAAGKSRAFINDTPVTLAAMRELGEHLIDIHSQHQNLLLGKEDFQVSVLDIMASNATALSCYRSAYLSLQEAKATLERMKKELAANEAEADFMRFQYKEIADADLVAGEQEELEERAQTMSHAEEIKTSLYLVDSMMNGEDNGLLNTLKSAISHLDDIAPVFQKSTSLSERLNNCYIEIKDVADEVGASVDDIDFDPREMQQINDRLDTIYTLQHKFHVDNVEALIEKRDEIKQRLDSVDMGDEKLEEQQLLVDELTSIAKEQAARITEKRRKAAKQVEKEMSERLVPLGIPKVRFEVNVLPDELSYDGADKVVFLFSANSSSPMRPVEQVASGGEIARVMLSLKAMIGNAVELPTIIFDEIDTGVSGRVAEQMAQIMKEMGSSDRQVISITHLPQIAALGTTHYKVAKEETATGTASRMTILDDEARVREIAQMLSGSEVTQAAVDNARELIEKGKNNNV